MKFLLALALAASGVIVSVPLFAHHGNASYDSTKTVTVKGTVTDYIWSNPHVLLKVDAKDNSGNTVHWIIEAQNPLSQTEVGWTKNPESGIQLTTRVTPLDCVRGTQSGPGLFPGLRR